MKINSTVYGKTKPEILKNITTEKIKLNQTEVDFIRLLTKDKQKILTVNKTETITVMTPQWTLRPEVDALNDFTLQARKTIRVAGYEKERKNSTEYMPKGLGTEIKKQNKKIDKKTAKILNTLFNAINETNKLNGEKVLQARHIDFEKVAKVIRSENAQNRAYVTKAVAVKLPKNMNKKKKMKLKKESMTLAKKLKENIHYGKTTAYKERQKLGKQNIIKMMEKGGFPKYYINMVKKFNDIQISMIFSSQEFFKYGRDIFYNEDDSIRYQATELLDFINSERKNLSTRDYNKEEDNSTLINPKEALKNEYISTTNTMRKQRKKAKK